MSTRGKFIVLYAANNLGKSTQLDLLSEKMTSLGMDFVRLKYPIYDLEPTGPVINSVLREGVQMEYRELQQTFAQNRRDFEPQLMAILNSGRLVLAEDYTGTGISWGITNGISLQEMEQMNAGLYPEDVSILIDGERFSSGRERGHLHEENGNWQRARESHLLLAERYGWERVNANQNKEAVAADIWKIIEGNIRGERE